MKIFYYLLIMHSTFVIDTVGSNSSLQEFDYNSNFFIHFHNDKQKIDHKNIEFFRKSQYSQFNLNNNIARKFYTGSNDRIALLVFNKKTYNIIGYVELEDHIRIVRNCNISKELNNIKDQEHFEALCQDAYVKVHLLNNKDITLSIHQRGLGGGKLHDLAIMKDTRQLLSYLRGLVPKARINEKDLDGQTALHRAVWSGNTNVVRLLLEHGCDTTVLNKNGLTALDISVCIGNHKITQLLIDHDTSLASIISKNFLALLGADEEFIPSLSFTSALSYSDPTDFLLIQLPRGLGVKIISFLKFTDRGNIKLACKDLYFWTWLSMYSYVFNRNLSSKELKLALSKVATVGTRIQKIILPGHIVNDSHCAQISSSFSSSDLMFEELNSQRLPLISLKIQGSRKITGTGIQYITSLQSLTKLDFGGCIDLTDRELSHVAKLSNLLSLSICNWKQVTDTGLQYIGQLQSLGCLSMSFCKNFTDKGLLHVVQLPNLTSLNISGCTQITNVGFMNIVTVSRLCLLNLSSCNRITSLELKKIYKLSNLVNLELSYNSQIVDETLQHMSTLKHLTKLDLSFCKHLTDVGVNYISKASGIIELNLNGNNQFSDASLQYIAQKLPNLISLYLGHCRRISDIGLKYLGMLKQLVFLDLQDNHNITKVGLLHLFQIPSLENLLLCNCHKITEDSIKEIYDFIPSTLSIEAGNFD